MTFLEPRDDLTQNHPPQLSIRVSPEGAVNISGDSKQAVEAALHTIHSADYRVSLQAQLSRELKPPDGRIESLTFLICVGTAAAFVFFLLFQMFQPTQCKANDINNRILISSIRG